MCLIAEVVAPLSAVPLGSAVEEHDVEVELERSVPTASRSVSFVWVRGPDAASFGEAVRSLPSVDDLTLVESVSGRVLYGVSWNVSQVPIFDALAERDAVLLECRSTVDSWWLKLRVSSYRVLTDLRREWAAHGIDTEFDRITTVAAEEAPPGEELTDAQLETLLLALERGYFDEHRATSLAELGAELGISRQAVAARLKRAYRTLAERIRDERPPQ
ncbi:helix-turn-helix domain-containing protein [Haloferax volcanii]|uniref:DNA binding domain-containing protein n=3 Tax=Haloferax volcanii TaxID=2246 RepID=A0A384KLW0_HALVD|nr:helix-turn-helix domain-containing protein [Haloferax volcanii]ADE04982.1 HTH-10 family transcription regulator [Haloferax volcanii DS2]ELY26361.1 DNA binding domain-containing protein [Haloferax volcanii DS2]MBS8120195.1 helix-turn-helix domain-containing protein [Haloferax volcanii]MBS8125233.1 helix-turn-helix domain-containing protein [Haloferax volcanii]MBS8129101.1 helix-turn-helix domain-containing protein [Haloferax volcanii]